MLRRLATAGGLGADFDRRALARLVSEEDHVRAVVAKVEMGEADVGLCYRSDVTAATARRVRLIEIPDSVNVQAEYPIATLRSARDPEMARAFTALVLSPEGQGILARHGFISAVAPSPATSTLPDTLLEP